jgi:hypothetical protein
MPIWVYIFECNNLYDKTVTEKYMLGIQCEHAILAKAFTGLVLHEHMPANVLFSMWSFLV